MQAIGQINEEKFNHKLLNTNKKLCYFVTTNCGEDNALWYF